MTATAYYAKFERGYAHLLASMGYSAQTGDGLFRQAVTHRSYDPKLSYERLEYLGDALLGAIIAQYLYHAHQTLDEGKLTRMRATLVCQETLVLIAEKLALHRHVVLGAGERKVGGRHRPSILADVVEALIGAIYLDSGSFETTKACVLSWYGDLLNHIDDGVILKDAKSRLQEWLQARKMPLPSYQLLEVIGNSPDQLFRVQCTVAKEGVSPMIETGSSRRIAEQKCAELMINQLTILYASQRK